MAIMGAIIADRLDLELGVVRKEEDLKYSPFMQEGKHGLKWLFLDDCISTGLTFTRVATGAANLGGEITAVMTWNWASDEKEYRGVPHLTCPVIPEQIYEWINNGIKGS